MNYRLIVEPHDVFPKRLPSNAIIESLLQSRCDQWEVRVRRVTIPTEVVVDLAREGP